MPLKSAFNTYVTFQFIRELTKKWTDMDAYKLGIIDDNGNILKKSRDLESQEERNAYSLFHRLVWNIKRLLEKVPGGKSRIATYGAAAWLLKENKELVEEHLLMILEEEGAPTNVSGGIEKTDKPLFTKSLKRKKKDEEDMEDKGKTESSIIALNKKLNEMYDNRLSEGKMLKKVIRKGKLVKKIKCPEGQTVQDGRCVPKTAKMKLTLRKAGKKRHRTLLGKSQVAKLRKQKKSQTKRENLGLN